jgi:hypothetical protein
MQVLDAAAKPETAASKAPAQPEPRPPAGSDWGIDCDDWGADANDWGEDKESEEKEEDLTALVEAYAQDVTATSSQKLSQKLTSVLIDPTPAEKTAVQDKGLKKKPAEVVASRDPDLFIPHYICVIEVSLVHVLLQQPQEPEENGDNFEHELRLLDAYRKAGGTLGDGDDDGL